MVGNFRASIPSCVFTVSKVKLRSSGQGRPLKSRASAMMDSVEMDTESIQTLSCPALSELSLVYVQVTDVASEVTTVYFFQSFSPLRLSSVSPFSLVTVRMS